MHILRPHHPRTLSLHLLFPSRCSKEEERSTKKEKEARPGVGKRLTFELLLILTAERVNNVLMIRVYSCFIIEGNKMTGVVCENVFDDTMCQHLSKSDFGQK